MGLTQAEMAADLDISPSYVALMEGNQRPVTAETLLRLAKAYKIDFSDLANETGPDLVTRLQAAVKDPILSDIEFGALEVADVAHSFPAFVEAMLRLHTAYKEEQFALADKRQHSSLGGEGIAGDPIPAVRSFLAARRNFFPVLDAASERLSAKIGDAGGLSAYLKTQHNLKVRRLPPDVMVGSLRRLDLHRKELLLSEALDQSSQNFQMAQQLAYLELDQDIQAIVDDGNFDNQNATRLAHRAIAAYAAAAIVMPYAAFAKAVENRQYDIDVLARQFSVSFEQTAHRLTTLQKAGQERIPFFFIKVDVAGNVSKRLNSGAFPFARHGGGCPLWNVHGVFATPRKVVTQWLELPDGQRFFSIARTVHAGGGGYGLATVDRAIAVVCEAQYADRLVYSRGHPQADLPTPIGIACQLCHRTGCTSRSEPPIGRQILADNFRRPEAPFGFSDA
ncbi:putative transcriptional regulator/transcriptional regulator with XRE-family HTH domain [Mycoplana sp. BE70]|nr:putative transcriptional regulator/transcriptional regulator with XRE-family HTH domain [Mycoplana sp. BE70]